MIEGPDQHRCGGGVRYDGGGYRIGQCIHDTNAFACFFSSLMTLFAVSLSPGLTFTMYHPHCIV